MKVGSSSGPYRPPATGPVRKAGRVDKAGSVGGVGGVGGASGVGGGYSSSPILDSIEIQGVNPAEISPRVQEVISSLMHEVEVLKNELQASNARIRELEDLADMDPLLPINNRRAFVRELRRMISFADRFGTPSTLMFIDLNDMKLINDNYGHETGDQALFHLAQILKINTRGTDVVGRLGGDEFGVILAQADTITGAEKAQELSDHIKSTPLHLADGSNFTLRFAYGLYTFSGTDEAEAALERADEAMYDHKRAMKGADNVR